MTNKHSLTQINGFENVLNYFINQHESNLIYFISPIHKNIIKQIDEKYLNKKITINDALLIHDILCNIWNNYKYFITIDLIEKTEEEKAAFLQKNLLFVQQLNNLALNSPSELQEKCLFFWKMGLENINSFTSNLQVITKDINLLENNSLTDNISIHSKTKYHQKIIQILQNILNSPEDLFAVFIFSSFLIVIPIAWYIYHLVH